MKKQKKSHFQDELRCSGEGCTNIYMWPTEDARIYWSKEQGDVETKDKEVKRKQKELVK